MQYGKLTHWVKPDWVIVERNMNERSKQVLILLIGIQLSMIAPGFTVNKKSNPVDIRSESQFIKKTSQPQKTKFNLKLKMDPVYDQEILPETESLNRLTPKYDKLNQEIKPKKRVVLQGAIKHSSVLLPVDKKFKIGAVFKEIPKSELGINEVWYRIPAWSSGKWHRETQTLIRQRGFTLFSKFESFLSKPLMGQTETSRLDYTLGTLVDAKGTIWNRITYPYTVKVEGRSSDHIGLIHHFSHISTSKEKLVTKDLSTGIEIDRDTNKILNVYQSENIYETTFKSPNMVVSKGSQKAFNSKGKPIMLSIVKSDEKQIAKFKPLFFEDGIDLRKSLNRFLKSKGMQERCVSLQ